MASVAKSQCPVCNAARVEKFRPFCSKRCAELDLGRWFTGSYAIPTEEIPDEFDIGMSEPEGDEEPF
ncbi:MAG: DNA gyrase inhibitor YacG [Alphaproteobacteria bacterium]